mgnify:CR=1 FL=1
MVSRRWRATNSPSARQWGAQTRDFGFWLGAWAVVGVIGCSEAAPRGTEEDGPWTSGRREVVNPADAAKDTAVLAEVGVRGGASGRGAVDSSPREAWSRELASATWSGKRSVS